MINSSAFELAGFGTSSPLEHSIKHSQLDGVTSAARLQEALLYKAAPSGGLLPTGASRIHPDVTADFAGAVKKRDLSCKVSHELQLPKAFRTSADHIKEPSELASPMPPIQPPALSNPLAPRALIVSEWIYSRDVVVKHVKTLMEERYDHIDQLDICHSHVEALQILTNPDKASYSWIIINLSMPQHIIPLLRHIGASQLHKDAITIVLTTHLQRSTIFDGSHQGLDEGLDNYEFVFKPLKRSKIELLFPSSKPCLQPDPLDPTQSTLNRSKSLRRSLPAAQQTVAGQQGMFQIMLAEVGHRGHRVLLVEGESPGRKGKAKANDMYSMVLICLLSLCDAPDNLVNQKVMTKYFMRVGLEADVVSDGCQCVDTVLSHPHDYYALVLCDLFMPIKGRF